MQTNHAVAAQSTAVSAMAQDWELIDALQSTSAMRAAGEKYLPRRELEELATYTKRLKRATLYPALVEAVNKMTGRVFAEPILANDNIPEWIRTEVLTDVDRQGRDLHAWCREWFSEALNYGLSHVIIDSPPDEAATLAEQKAKGIRPYFVKIHPRRVLGWRADEAGTLTQVRISFTRVEQDGDFGEKTVQQVKVYEPGQVRTFELVRSPNGAGDQWIEPDPPVRSGLPIIPLVTLYTKRTGLLTATPRLMELAQLNAKHWQQQSSLDTLLDIACVPILTISGANDNEKLVVGANSVVYLPQNASMSYCEHTGAAIAAGAQQIETLKQEMAQIGAKLLEKRESVKTAAQSSEEASDANSELGAMARTLQDTLAQVLYIVALWRGGTEGGTVKVQANLAPDTTPVETVGALANLERQGIVSAQTVFDVAKSRKMIPDEIDWETEQVRRDSQGPRVPAMV